MLDLDSGGGAVGRVSLFWRRSRALGDVVADARDACVSSSELAGPVEQRIRVDRRAGPPAFVGVEASHGKVEVGRVFRSIAGGADVADDIAAAEELPFVQAGRVGVEMRVVVAVALVGIELVHGQA